MFNLHGMKIRECSSHGELTLRNNFLKFGFGNLKLQALKFVDFLKFQTSKNKFDMRPPCAIT
jgi:hypothetical protein